MYRIGQKVLKLDGIITEFSDIYAPLAQMFILDSSESKLDKNLSEDEWSIINSHTKLSKQTFLSLFFKAYYLLVVDLDNLASSTDEYLEIYWAADFL